MSSDNVNNNKDDEEAKGSKPGGIAAFVAHTGAIGHVIMGTARKDSSEPLPFLDTTLFNEDEGGFILFLMLFLFLLNF